MASTKAPAPKSTLAKATLLDLFIPFPRTIGVINGGNPKRRYFQVRPRARVNTTLSQPVPDAGAPGSKGGSAKAASVKEVVVCDDCQLEADRRAYRHLCDDCKVEAEAEDARVARKDTCEHCRAEAARQAKKAACEACKAKIDKAEIDKAKADEAAASNKSEAKEPKACSICRAETKRKAQLDACPGCREKRKGDPREKRKEKSREGKGCGHGETCTEAEIEALKKMKDQGRSWAEILWAMIKAIESGDEHQKQDAKKDNGRVAVESKANTAKDDQTGPPRYNIDEWIELTEDEDFTFDNLKDLGDILAGDVDERWERVASRHFDATGHRVTGQQIQDKFRTLERQGVT